MRIITTVMIRFTKINVYYMLSSFSGGTILLLNQFSVVELGPDHVVPAINFSCTVVNEGSFIWQWRLPDGSHLTSTGANVTASGRYTLYRSSGTNTSILEVGGLSYQDKGVYQCEVRHKAWDVVLGTNSSLLQLQCENSIDTLHVLAKYLECLHVIYVF